MDSTPASREPVPTPAPAANASPNAAFLSGGGAAAALIRSVDWAATALGPPEGWPMSLRTIVRTMLQSRHPMFLWWGPELIQLFNDAYLPSFGVGKLPAAMGQRGADCWQEIWPIIWPQIDDVMARARASWNEDQLVPIFRNGRVEEVYWTYGYSPVFDEADAIAGTLVVCTETTARVLAERRLRTLSALAARTAAANDLGELAGAVSQGLLGAAPDVPFAALFRAGAESDGADPLSTVRLSLDGWRAIEPAVRAAASRPLGARVALPDAPGAPGGEAFVAPVAAGVSLVLGLSARLPFDEAYREHLARLTDDVATIAARIEAQDVRVATQRARDNLLMQAPVATAVLIGPRHVFELANPRYEQMVGRRSLIGKAYAEAFPELVETALPAVLDRVYQTGEPFVTEEYPVTLELHGDGRLLPRFFKFNVEAMRDARGQVFGMMVVAVDITEQVSARHVLEQAHVEREKLLTGLETAVRAKDEFLAMLGHELRNPLAPIVTALDLMKLRGDPSTAREQEILSRQVEHLVRLVDDLLDVSRITRGEIELRRETLEIAAVAARAVEIASVLLERRGHHLVIDVPAAGLALEGDPVRLAQVIANLLTNAARYTDPGGHIRVAAAREGEEIVVSVTDDGIGMAPELLPSIFDVFFQGRRSADRAEGGLGLGLALVKSLVAMHGGSVLATSAGLGKGSAFVVRLPAAAAGAPVRVEPATRPSGGTPASVSRRVLVVDDNSDAADLLAALLRRAGHVVTVAYNPLTALDTAATFGPEVTILDIGLPVMDGYELAERLRAHPATARCRLIALTGYGQAHDFARSAQSSFETHLVKPVEIKKLVQLIGEEAPAPGGPDR